MKILVTGAGGFVGKHLIKELLKRNHKVVALGIGDNSALYEMGIPVYETNILDFNTVYKNIQKEQPDGVIHLAAQSNVGVSWDKPQITVSVNIEGTLNLYKALFEINPDGKFLNIGSSDEYGLTAKKEISLTEEMECKPQNPYSISKFCSEQMILQLAKKDNVNVVSTRSFNHFGPGQMKGFVISDFASQIAEIKKGVKENKIYVGDLSPARDFLYVDDVVDAYILLMENRVVNGVYNISSGKSYTIELMLNKLIEISNIDIEILIDKKKFRPAEVKNFIGNSDKLFKALKWKPKVDLNEGLKKTLSFWIDKK
ncbi:GDP-mannose 4,6-dehydratase [Megamonas hypermegale]|uniref:GDP-mannose 4,6-dehydratase n=1 Tax=Megamonas hypermegale TaxID=158847 RepID=UPI0026F0CCEA|nr:GDP-mannose 4,6-dehydratase [Megamonas hypermegale]